MEMVLNANYILNKISLIGTTILKVTDEVKTLSNFHRKMRIWIFLNSYKWNLNDSWQNKIYNILRTHFKVPDIRLKNLKYIFLSKTNVKNEINCILFL